MYSQSKQNQTRSANELIRRFWILGRFDWAASSIRLAESYVIFFDPRATLPELPWQHDYLNVSNRSYGDVLFLECWTASSITLAESCASSYEISMYDVVFYF